MNFKNIYLAAIRESENWIDKVPPRLTVHNPESEMNGFIVSFQMINTFSEVGGIPIAVALYFSKESKYYKDKKILELIKTFARVGIKKLNDDGTFDMPETNFHTGEQFALARVSRALLVMNMYVKDDKDELEAKEAICDIVEKVATGCLNGGFHTPNHRWVETAGLLQARRGLLDAGRTALCDRLLDKANRYLAEGVDCDEDGEWSERSAGMYNAHCDDFFLSIYEMTGNEEYYDAVYRNLMLMRYYIGNNFAMFTQNSRRVDKGEVGSRPMFFKATTYYANVYQMQYVIAAYLKKDALLASVAEEIFDHTVSTEQLVFFTLHPDMAEWEFEKVPNAIPETYEKYQPKSLIVRKKTADATYSFLARNPAFLQIEADDIKLNVRLCSSFFAVAQFVPRNMTKTERGYMLSMRAHGEYKLPLENPDGITTKDYWSIDYSARKPIQQLDLDMSVEIVFVDGGADLYVKVDNCPHVPTKLEFFVNPGLHCEIGDAVMTTTSGANVFSRGSAARFESISGKIMTIDGLFCKHLYADGMRGSLDPISDAFVLYATDYSPVERKISIRFETADGARIH